MTLILRDREVDIDAGDTRLVILTHERNGKPTFWPVLRRAAQDPNVEGMLGERHVILYSVCKRSCCSHRTRVCRLCPHRSVEASLQRGDGRFHRHTGGRWPDRRRDEVRHRLGSEGMRARRPSAFTLSLPLQVPRRGLQRGLGADGALLARVCGLQPAEKTGVSHRGTAVIRPNGPVRPV